MRNTGASTKSGPSARLDHRKENKEDEFLHKSTLDRHQWILPEGGLGHGMTWPASGCLRARMSLIGWPPRLPSSGQETTEEPRKDFNRNQNPCNEETEEDERERTYGDIDNLSSESFLDLSGKFFSRF